MTLRERLMELATRLPDDEMLAKVLASLPLVPLNDVDARTSAPVESSFT